MSRIPIIVLWVMLVSGQPALTQVISVQGKISCKKMLIAKCIDNIRVTLDIPGDYSAVTDTKGTFRINRVPNRYLGTRITVILGRGDTFIATETATLSVANGKARSGGPNSANLVVESDCFSCDENESVISKTFKRLAWGVASAVGALVNESHNATGSQTKVTMGSGQGFPTHLEPELSTSQINSGEFLSYPFSASTASPGFAFSPTMNYARSIFSNPAAMNRTSGGESQVLTNFNDQLNVSLLVPLGNSFRIGLGYAWYQQTEHRNVFEKAFSVNHENALETVEQAYFVATSVRLHSQLSLGLTAKYISQSSEIPIVFAETVVDSNNLVGVRVGASQDRIDSGYYDIDIGAHFEIVPGLNMGLSLLNLAGTKLLAKDNYAILDNHFISYAYPDPFPQNETTLRALGLGFSYQRGKVHYGSDLQINEDGEGSFSLGFLYQPFSTATFSVGYASEHDSFIASMQYSFVSYAFNKNDVFGNSHLAGLVVRF